TAVDNEPAMLAALRRATGVLADVTRLDLGRRFGAVLLMSHFVDAADAGFVDTVLRVVRRQPRRAPARRGGRLTATGRGRSGSGGPASVRRGHDQRPAGGRDRSRPAAGTAGVGVARRGGRPAPPRRPHEE